ncbi:GNAT family N-acetyltransferase [Thalassobacter stenotrophicus]|uniref:Ribosomal-protein-alanine N-acetyltransferase n=2 Tax=Thalassobacter stenotrophicus TaxID=266809 RepID=A0A0P1FJM8_9RHOB|nr:GNAT family N-acetyltransferase [Thalassobacter stenotrophicus]CUH61670.1 ribosomal-protein-alanine N-acetyltransferase [Thalassobacter stenotrophicus]SHI45033.1 ribosomal-protein-alanine N-acetyltransferase [Thalassobacter stenotrophicus DSM 16310]
MMTPEDMAALHAQCFQAAPRPWSAQEFAAYAQDTNVLIRFIEGGFGVVRVIADEAELLTLAVDPARRRQGLGDALVQSLCTGAKVAGAQDMFLEVAADNAAACALYSKHGFARVGRRPAYYAGTDALVLRRAM